MMAIEKALEEIKHFSELLVSYSHRKNDEINAICFSFTTEFLDALETAMNALKLVNNCENEYKNEYKTCKGCSHNIVVNGIQVCWLPFSLKNGDVHTVSSITDESERCEFYKENYGND